MFSKDAYINRRAKLIENLQTGLVLFMGNEECPRNYKDNCFKFRQDSSFLYFFGLDIPKLTAVIDLDEGHTTIFGDEATMDDIIWMGPLPSLNALADRCGVTATARPKDLEIRLKKAKENNRPVHFLPPYAAENKIKLSNWLDIPIQELASYASVELIESVVKLRSVKSGEEIREMEKAINVSRAMHIAVMKSAKPDMKEHELLGIAEGIAISSGGELSYPGILTVNGHTLHNHYYGNTLQAGQLVLADLGAEINSHYCGDITRTLPVSAHFSIPQKEIYSIVLNTLENAIQRIRAGEKYLDIHIKSALDIASGLKDLGLLHGSIEDAVENGAHALFFPHGLGHMIGLDVHDMEDLDERYVGYEPNQERSKQFGLRSLRLAKTLEAGYCVTVEPGIYFIPELIDQWRGENKLTAFIDYNKVENYRGFGGVRIEDNVLVTTEGCKILGKAIPKTIAEIETLKAR